MSPTAFGMFDPFAEANADNSGAGTKEYVHVCVQQHNGQKSPTTVQGLKKEFSYGKILMNLKKEFFCDGTVVQDQEMGQVMVAQVVAPCFINCCGAGNFWKKLKTHACYFIYCKKKFEKLKIQFNLLKAVRDDTQQKVLTAERNNEVISDEVNLWLNKVLELEGKFNNIENNFNKMVRDKKCCIPSLLPRYKVGREATRKRVKASELLHGKNFKTFSHTYPITSLPTNCFENMVTLIVLDLSDTYITCLPLSSACLKKLGTLRLDRCKWLNDINVVGELKTLIILSLQECIQISALPENIVALVKLKLLDLSYCTSLQIPRNLMPKLTRLEELYFRGCNVTEALFIEVATLKYLARVDSTISEFRCNQPLHWSCSSWKLAEAHYFGSSSL